MNVLRLRAFARPPAVRLSCRPFATQHSAFVPPMSTENMQQERKQNQLPTPTSPSFYTARSSYFDHVTTLERAVQHSRQMLTALNLFPLPKIALQSLPPLTPVWKSKLKLSVELETKLSATRYRRLLDLLNEINHFRRIADTAGHDDLAHGLQDILDVFERDDKEQHLQRGRRKPVVFDQYGRSYTLGKRKTSSARVWMIANHAAKDESSDRPPTTQILINNVPLNQFFLAPADREKILRPFKIAGLVGAYNVFALVRGGGTTGQSGAVAHGIAKALAAHEPAVELILRRSKLSRRDPRMVERKKTGRAKARKGYTWVKR